MFDGVGDLAAARSLHGLDSPLRVEARIAAPKAVDWLGRKPKARVLNAFARSCNLISSDGEIVSFVSAEIGPGPFAVVVGELPDRAPEPWESITVRSEVQVSENRVQVGELIVVTDGAVLWNPRPIWDDVRQDFINRHRQSLAELLASQGLSADRLIPPAEGQLPGFHRSIDSAWRTLALGLKAGDSALCREGARGMAGLGNGLTPAGDDFLMGVFYAMWAKWASPRLRPLLEVMLDAASPRTTALSVTWLRAAARGEAAEPWHRLVEALADSDQGTLQTAAEGILVMGHSSGRDALAGFTAGLEALSKSSLGDRLID